MTMVRPILGSWALAVCVAGCGVELGIDETRGYTFEIVGSDDPAVERLFGKLIDELNRGVGTSQFALAHGNGESVIRLAPLTGEDGTVGLGSPVERVVDWQIELPGVSLTPPRRRAILHTMILILDRDWVKQRVEAADAESVEKLRQLLFHEIGHGLGLGHDADATAVMYRSLGGVKDYEPFFAAVQRQLED